MIRQLRRSFAAKLIAGGCLLGVVVVSGVAGYLIYSRTTQTVEAARSNAENRVGVMAQVLERFTGTEALSAATTLATTAPLVAALSSPTPGAAVTTLLRTASVDLTSGDVIVVSDASGNLLYTQAAASLGTLPAVTQVPDAIRVTLAGGLCRRADSGPVRGGCGTEVLSAGYPAFVVAVPVVDGRGTVVGAVAYAAPLADQLNRFEALFGFPTVFVDAGHTGTELRPSARGTAPTTAGLRGALAGASGATVSSAVYDAPVQGGGTGSVAGSFVAVHRADGTVSGFMGVEVPVAQFVGDERTDIVVLALIAVFVLLIVALAVILFVARFVKRPIARLERGVARIADGDYASDIEVRSKDEIGRLASNVNRMRHAIAGYVREVEEAKERVDAAVEQVSVVSRALTTTTNGVGALHDAVVRTAAAIAGGGTAAVLALRDGDELRVIARSNEMATLEGWSGLDGVVTGDTVQLRDVSRGLLLAVPMFYQDEVVGALAVLAPPGSDGPDAEVHLDADVLAVLANNAAIAMENARLFEQERQTVQRLLELDAMKTDFLSTVQHELRTPLTAILGLSDLMEMCWEMWEDSAKLDAVHDIQVAGKNLYDIVETIIDFSAMEGSQLGLNPAEVPLRQTLDSALELVGERYKGGLPVPVDVEGPDDVVVYADPARLIQVLRAVIDNAMKFSDGRGRVRVRVASAERDGAVQVSITDQGIGIPADDLPRIFDRFFQVDNTATRKFGGTGMGLALVKLIVEAHGANVAVTSTVGEGTTVVLEWPTSAPVRGDEPHDELAGDHPTGEPRPAPAPVPVQ